MKHGPRIKLHERDVLIVRDYLNGMNRAEIAAKYGVVRSTVYHRVSIVLQEHYTAKRSLPADLAAKIKKVDDLAAQIEKLREKP